MTKLISPTNPGWPDVTRFEVVERLLGGDGGPLNRAPLELLERTEFLKKQIDDLVSGALIAEYADRLKTPRNIAMTGDGSWSVAFDGSGNASAALTLANSGVVAGTYGMLTVDIKGRVTAARALAAADIPALGWSKIASGKPTTLSGYGITDAASIRAPVFEDRITVPEGTQTAPSISFLMDGNGDTGFWHIADGMIGVTCNGVESVRFGPAGIQFPGVAAALSTPQALASALGNDPNFFTTITTLARAAAPSGLIGYFAGSAAPAGWLRANGAAVSRATYAALYAAIGTTYGAGDGAATFNLPDLRGEFVRGWDDGRGADAGRALGSWQSDLVGPHDHNIRRMPDGASLGLPSPAAGGAWAYGSGVTSADLANVYTTAKSGMGNESRPRNIALLACIKI
ncbi:hypothetical protein DK842_21410 [Chromobacterium phragmitis]|uniref:tail fiber protein n=1 Tax=Chromobacterium phragmitis TaxID=2202141 RepID=UPI000DED369F|nr:tail fiber protein [Chromobacterium phragmitis]AXE32240.1 hypothetical protein DK842_21410 [Chromobacterium phragmitis]